MTAPIATDPFDLARFLSAQEDDYPQALSEIRRGRKRSHFPDHLKLRSSATLFASVSPEGSVFHRILDRHYNGEPDARTLALLSA